MSNSWQYHRRGVFQFVMLVPLCGALFASCRGPSQYAAEQRNVERQNPALEGDWRWTQSKGGPLNELSTSTDEDWRYLTILPNQRYRETLSGHTAFEGTFSLGSGSTFENDSVVVPVIRFEHAILGGYFGPEDQYAFSIKGDTLRLVGTSSHAWTHIYVQR